MNNAFFHRKFVIIENSVKNPYDSLSKGAHTHIYKYKGNKYGLSGI